jgi:hypothetical protein
MPGKTNEGKRKINDRNHQNTNGDAAVLARAILALCTLLQLSKS